MKRRFTHVVIGTSAGGVEALRFLIPALRADFALPVIVVLHLPDKGDSALSALLNDASAVQVKEAEDKEYLQPATVYLAPPGYHVLAEADNSLSLSVEEKVNFSRPSIDVLFETAADAFGDGLIGIVLTGANNDGARGLARITARGGLPVVQDPATAKAEAMPKAALLSSPVDVVLPLEGIAHFLNNLTE